MPLASNLVSVGGKNMDKYFLNFKNSTSIQEFNESRSRNGERLQISSIDTPYFPISIGQICAYIKNYHKEGNKIGFCIVLEESSKLNPSVFVCPIEILKKYNPNITINVVYLGKMPLLELDNNYYGIINEIKIMDKRRIIMDDNFINKSYGFVSTNVLNEINSQYFNLIETHLNVEKNSYYEKTNYC